LPSLGLSILGFNPAGTRLYDEVFCGYHGGASATYNERGVNLQTGALGADAQVHSWNNSYGGGEYVQFVNGLLFDFVVSPRLASHLRSVVPSRGRRT
jgi:hypothetical protein